MDTLSLGTMGQGFNPGSCNIDILSNPLSGTMLPLLEIKPTFTGFKLTNLILNHKAVARRAWDQDKAHLMVKMVSLSSYRIITQESGYPFSNKTDAAEFSCFNRVSSNSS